MMTASYIPAKILLKISDSQFFKTFSIIIENYYMYGIQYTKCQEFIMHF